MGRDISSQIARTICGPTSGSQTGRLTRLGINGASSLKDIPHAFFCCPVHLCTPPSSRKATEHVPGPHLGTLWHKQLASWGLASSSKGQAVDTPLQAPRAFSTWLAHRGPKGLTENSEPPENMKGNRCVSWAMFQPHFLRPFKCPWKMHMEFVC